MLYDHGLAKFDTTTLSTKGSAVASMLSDGTDIADETTPPVDIMF